MVARWPSELSVSAGQGTRVKLDMDKALLFDGATENRIA
jgi:hypothetical protein